MKTIIFDIDGTITNMWPIEKSVLLDITQRRFENDVEQMKLSGISDTYKIFLRLSHQKMSKKNYTNLYKKTFSILLKNDQLPKPEKYPLTNWILDNKERYRFVSATGGQKIEAHYVLKIFKVIRYVDLIHSIDKTSCRFSKKTGIPFRKIKSKFKNCILISDSNDDCKGAQLAKVPFVLIEPRQRIVSIVDKHTILLLP